MPTTRERRFVGNGNAVLNGRGGWRVFCSKCDASKVIGSSGRKSLPPNIIIKKLARSGWQIGNSSKDDLCPQCNHKPIESHLKLATKALNDFAAPMVSDGERQTHFSEVLAIAKTLDPEQAKQLIEVLRQRIPQRPKTVRSPKPESKSEETDYDHWLDRVDGEAHGSEASQDQ